MSDFYHHHLYKVPPSLSSRNAIKAWMKERERERDTQSKRKDAHRHEPD